MILTYRLVTPVTVLRPAMGAAPVSLLAMQNLSPDQDLLN